MSEAPRGGPPQQRGRHRMFWRVYLHGVVLLVLVAVATAGAALLEGRYWEELRP